MSTQHKKMHQVQSGIVLLVLTLIVVGSLVLTQPKPSKMTSSSSLLGASSSNSSSSQQVDYMNGTFTATGSYTSPGGNESLKVTVTLAGDVVSDVTAVSEANDPTASSYQAIFLSGYKSQVVGKKIDSIKLKNVSGSSLTPIGFNSALTKIKAEAKS